MPQREAAKKNPPLMAARANKEKRTFFDTYLLILLPFKNKKYFTLDNLSKYETKVVKIRFRLF